MACSLSWGCLFMVLCLAHSALPTCSGCLMEERAALMDIRSLFVSAQSKVPVSWGRSDDCCSWERITCDNGTRRISRLKLSAIYQPIHTNEEISCWNMSLAIFSPFLGLRLLDFASNQACLQDFEGLQGLNKLKYLDLSDNYLLDSIPGSVGELISLEVINLNGNSLGMDLHNSGFQNLHYLRNLREVHLRSNQLSGSLPASIFALPYLEYLDLSGNNFVGPIPINSSSNLRELYLKFNNLGGSLPASIFVLPYLEYLDLSKNHFEGHIHINSSSNLRELYLSLNQFSSLPASLFALPCLEYLDLSENLLQGHITMNSSSNLRELYLSSNQFGSLPASLFALPCLEYLDLSENLLQGHIPMNSSSNLRELYFRSNQLNGTIPASLFTLPGLEHVDLSKNLLQGHIPINSSWKCSSLLQTISLSENKLSGKLDLFWLRKCMKLERIDLSGNADLVVQVKLRGRVPKFQLKTLMLSSCNLDRSIITEPHFLRTQRHLQFLDLSNNNLPGSMPSWLFTNEAALEFLDLSDNSLVGSLHSIWQRQSNLKNVNISLNRVEGQLPNNISVMFPNLTILDVSDNIISGTIPSSLCNIESMGFMDLSNNKFRGAVPSCLFTGFMLNVLKLSNNSLGGKILDGVSHLSNLWAIYLDNNKFEGTLPRNLSSNGDMQVMDLHGNKISGELDTSLWNLPSLAALSLANNGLTGDIHPGICNLTNLQLLDLSDNYFAGRMPNCSSKLLLEFLSVSGNSLSGFPSAFFNRSYITALDLSHNQFTGNLEWTQYLSKISVLLLGCNKFGGKISPNVCHLQHLSIIDISHNILWGSIPPCIGGIQFEVPDADEYNWPRTHGNTYGDQSDDYSSYNSDYELQGFTFTTKGSTYIYGQNFFMSMSGIDLSANMLSGEIPQEIGNLSHIKSLNLSGNFFTGSIPAAFANLREIESIDLSENRLNGSIPWELTRLSSLEVFRVAYNNLSGCVPDSGQFPTFGIDSYRGNDNLRSCRSSSRPVAPNGAAGIASGDSDPILWIITAVSYILALWATVTFVFCHSFGQRVILKL